MPKISLLLPKEWLFTVCSGLYSEWLDLYAICIGPASLHKTTKHITV